VKRAMIVDESMFGNGNVVASAIADGVATVAMESFFATLQTDVLDRIV
jgi:hypothetical protein